MSDYNPTYTYQWRDYPWARRERERTGNLLVKAPVRERTVPNPLSVELRIVLVYFWRMYKGYMEHARQMGEKSWEEGGSLISAASYEGKALEVLLDVHNICWDLFSPASPHSHIHIHSMYGCNNDDCPLWGLGYEAAQENVLDWYEPNS